MIQADLQSVLTKMVSENQKARERFAKTASRTISAIAQGNSDELTNIIRDAESEYFGEGEEVSPEPMEAGNLDGTTGSAGTTAPQT